VITALFGVLRLACGFILQITQSTAEILESRVPTITVKGLVQPKMEILSLFTHGKRRSFGLNIGVLVGFIPLFVYCLLIINLGAQTVYSDSHARKAQ